MNDNKVNCSVCGEVIELTFSYCPSCGAKIEKVKEKLVDSKTNPVDHQSKSYGSKKTFNNTEEILSEKKQIEKSISTVKLLYIVIGLVLVGFVLLLSSGIF